MQKQKKMFTIEDIADLHKHYSAVLQTPKKRISTAKLQKLTDSLNNDAHFHSDSKQVTDVTNIPSAILQTYGIPYKESEDSSADPKYLLSAITYRKGTVRIDETRILQNGIELWRIARLNKLNSDTFQRLVEQEPLEILCGKGNWILQGNHRLLYAALHGHSTLNATFYHIDDRHFRSYIFTELGLLGQDNITVDSVLVKSFCNSMAEYLSK
jgi:hypothetical protein